MDSDYKEISAGILSPFLVHKIWGGSRLAKCKNIPEDSLKGLLGETWEVSCHPDGPSSLAGKPLSKLVNEKDLPYLIKFIDTEDNLSIQVHPGDDYANKHESQSGKTECWIILDADPGSGIYLGLKKGIEKETLKKIIEENEDLSKLLNFYPVKKGDFFYVPSGSIHAIGKGVTLVEVQQSSGITYRVWDWNRVDENGKSRTLHIEKALDVINFSNAKNTLEYFQFNGNIFDAPSPYELIEHDQFLVNIFPENENSVEISNDGLRHWSLINLNNELRVKSNDQELALKPFSAFLVPIGKKVDIISSNSSYLLVK
jgi:mannose-6-phosphate isomerase